jgi:hypothetical protein
LAIEETAMTNRVTAVERRANAAGDQIIEVTCSDGAKIDVAIDLAAAQTLVQYLQEQLVEWAHKSAKNLNLPQLDVTRVDMAHQGGAAELMVSTAQMGRMVLRVSDDMLRHAQKEIDRVLQYRSPSSAAH